MRQQQRAVRRIAGPEENVATLLLTPLRASRNCWILEGDRYESLWPQCVAESSELPRLLVT